MEIFKQLPIELQENIYLFIPDREHFDEVMHEFVILCKEKETNKNIFNKTIFKLQNCIKCWQCELLMNPQKSYKFCIHCGSRMYAKIFSHFMSRIQ